MKHTRRWRGAVGNRSGQQRKPEGALLQQRLRDRTEVALCPRKLQVPWAPRPLGICLSIPWWPCPPRVLRPPYLPCHS